jgi:hypothetical protein
MLWTMKILQYNSWERVSCLLNQSFLQHLLRTMFEDIGFGAPSYNMS